MKYVGKLAVLGAVLVASAPFALGSSIALTGGLTVVGNDKTDDSFTPTSISFSIPAGNPSSNALITGATGNLSFAGSTTGTLFTFTSTTTNQTIFTDNDTQALSFELLNIVLFTDTYTPGFGTNLVIKGSGKFFDTAGDISETGTFALSSSDTECLSTSCTTPDDISFDFTPAAVPTVAAPEPGSLLLLGTGLITAARMLLRRHRINS